MARLSRALALLTLLGGTFFVGAALAARRPNDPSLRSLNAMRLEAVKRWDYSARGRNGAGDPRRSSGSTVIDTSPPSKVKNITFTNPKASGECATRAHALTRLRRAPLSFFVSI